MHKSEMLHSSSVSSLTPFIDCLSYVLSVSVNLQHYKMKDTNHMIVSMHAGKIFDKLQHTCMIKTLSKVGLEGAYLNIVKSINGKPTANFIRNGQKLKVFLLRLGTRQGCLLSPLSFNMVLKALATAIRK